MGAKFYRLNCKGIAARKGVKLMFCRLLNQKAVSEAVKFCVSQKPEVPVDLLREYLLLKVSELLEEMVK